MWAEYVRRFLADADVCRGKQKLYNVSKTFGKRRGRWCVRGTVVCNLSI